MSMWLPGSYVKYDKSCRPIGVYAPWSQEPAEVNDVPDIDDDGVERCPEAADDRQGQRSGHDAGTVRDGVER